MVRVVGKEGALIYACSFKARYRHRQSSHSGQMVVSCLARLCYSKEVAHVFSPKKHVLRFRDSSCPRYHMSAVSFYLLSLTFIGRGMRRYSAVPPPLPPLFTPTGIYA